MGFKTPKKALATEGFSRWAQNDRLRSKKSPIFAKFRTFASKTLFGALFAAWTAKTAENRFRATFGSKNVPRTLCFPLFGARRQKDAILLKSCSSEKKKQQKGFYLRDIKT